MTTSSIRDDNVLKDYHDQFIPKAVKYSAGLLDYFFRGQIAVTVLQGTNQSTLTVYNLSGTPLLDGTFNIYQQQPNGDRNLVQQSSLAGLLGDGDGLVINYTNQVNTNATYLMVYQGTVGAAGSSAKDPVDANIAVAATQFGLYQYASEAFTYTQWDSSCYNYIVGVYDVPAGFVTSPISVDDADSQAWLLMGYLYPTPIVCD